MLAEYIAGARNAVRTCLNVHEGDRLAIIETADRREIADAIAEEAAAAGGEVRRWVMDEVVARPAREFPRSLADAILALRPTVSYYVGEGMRGELAFRQPMLDLLTRQLRARHGHMIGVDRRLMVDGMATDYDEVYRVTRRVWEVARRAARIEVYTALGTELVATFNPAWKWIPSDGRYWEQGQWGNLPEGEVFTAPATVEGRIVADVLGDYFSAKYGVLEHPVTFELRDGRIERIEAADAALAEELRRHFWEAENGRRAGEFAIGTLEGLTRLSGNLLQDEKMPGLHVAFGNPYPHSTGADWESPVHVDVVATGCTIAVDGREIMRDGRFTL